jgi:hypothetical protein
MFVSFFFSCSSQLRLQKRTNWLIKKSHIKADTIYLYSVACNDFNLVWYYKDDFIHSFLVKPNETKRYIPIEAKNIAVSSDSINKYFDNPSYYNGIQCFERMLDGEWIDLYIKRRSRMNSSIDTECLFNTKFEPNSFPYKLQYDFSKIHRPIDFDFEKMYSE